MDPKGTGEIANRDVDLLQNNVIKFRKMFPQNKDSIGILARAVFILGMPIKQTLSSALNCCFLFLYLMLSYK